MGFVQMELNRAFLLKGKKGEYPEEYERLLEMLFDKLAPVTMPGWLKLKSPRKKL